MWLVFIETHATATYLLADSSLLTSISSLTSPIKLRKRCRMFCVSLVRYLMVLYILKIVAASRGFYPSIFSEIQKVEIFMLIDEIPSKKFKSFLIMIPFKLESNLLGEGTNSRFCSSKLL